MPESIVYLEDSADLRHVFKNLIEHSLGVTCVTYSSMANLVENAEGVLCSRMVFLDINLGVGEPNGVDAYQWLQSKKYGGKILFLTGHGQSHPLVLEAEEIGVEVLVKPISADRLLSIVRSFVPSKKGAS